MKGKRIALFCGTLILCILFLNHIYGGFSAGAEQSLAVPGVDYVLPENSNFEYSDATPVAKFFYGAGTLGTMKLNGAIEKETTYNGYSAYGATGDLTIQYAYNGAYQLTKEENWHVESDGTRWIRDYDLGFLNNIAKGCIMIEKSSDGSTWSKAIDPIKNYFDKKKTAAESNVLSIPEYEYKNGMYYRVVVAYKFAKRIKPSLFGGEYDRRKCVEVYEFYVCSEKNYVTFRDMGLASELDNNVTSEAGFMIRKNGSQATVTVNGDEKECKDYDFFTEPGEYSFDITTNLGKKYSRKITVAGGLDFTSLLPKAYESEKDKGFPLTKPVNQPVFGSHLTSLSLAIPKGYAIKKIDTSYGITGSNIYMYLKLNKSSNLGKGWLLSSDTWGKNTKQQVYGVQTGEVGKGALIIMKSRDGKSWENVDLGRYSKGLYTTNYGEYYGKDENVLIYTPYGPDVINGVYIKIVFAYQVNHISTKEYRDYIEMYQFYLCSDNLGAVTFHNLSVEDTLDESFADEDQNTIEVYKQSETLTDGDYTATGFQIDKTLNPTVKHLVLRNGLNTDNVDNKYDQTGKYDITLTSMMGSKKEITIYVDRMTPEEAMTRYFGEGFISGKRIFSEGECPVYEGGETSYYVAGVDDNVLPLYGQIRNLSTGSVITVEQNRDEKTGVISEQGEYQAIFATTEKAFTGELTGDARVFTFRFVVIPQGSAPGPAVNQKLLAEYSHTTAADSNPVYYGLTYSSAEKGHITLAFATKEAAAEYAYNYEKGTVELQNNGEYRYTGSFLVDQKTKFDSAWDLTDAVNYFAEAAVHKHFFDMSDEFTYLSLAQETLETNANLRQLELPRSVTIFADGQKEKLTDTDALPLLNDKPYAYLDPATGEVDRGFYSFEFITDQYGGIDSKSVTITDSKGGQHAIRYSESVGQQLLADKCPGGIVTIHEETMYGDSADYQAIYIAPDESSTELTLTCTNGEDKASAAYMASDNGQRISADSFTITGLRDPLDPYAFVIVSHNQHEDVYTVRDSVDTVWTDPGEYRITCRNRMGYGYTVYVSIATPEGMAIPEQMTAEVTPELTAAVEPAADDTQTEEVSTPSEEAENQSDKTVSATADESAENSTGKPTENISEPEDANSGNGNNLVLVIGILAGACLIVGLIIFAYRRIKLFKTSDSMKGGEDDSHE